MVRNGFGRRVPRPGVEHMLLDDPRTWVLVEGSIGGQYNLSSGTKQINGELCGLAKRVEVG